MAVATGTMQSHLLGQELRPQRNVSGLLALSTISPRPETVCPHTVAVWFAVASVQHRLPKICAPMMFMCESLAATVVGPTCLQLFARLTRPRHHLSECTCNSVMLLTCHF